VQDLYICGIAQLKVDFMPQTNVSTVDLDSKSKTRCSEMHSNDLRVC